jgi:NAD(P)-dependent dehydrogenase (short-subunit alcohol dehydrogenase family)
MDNLMGRRVLITNVGIGPGPTIVAELIRRGARVVIQHAYDDKVANETATNISGMTGSEPTIV